MDAFDFKKLKPTNFPDGAYLIILVGATCTDGVLLLHMKVVMGWPNLVLTTLQALQEPPQQLLETVNRFLQGPYNKSLFNMAIYEVDDTHMVPQYSDHSRLQSSAKANMQAPSTMLKLT